MQKEKEAEAAEVLKHLPAWGRDSPREGGKSKNIFHPSNHPNQGVVLNRRFRKLCAQKYSTTERN